jgi:hypothetical protein
VTSLTSKTSRPYRGRVTDNEDRDALLRRIRWHVGNAENGLDHATTALTRVRELDQGWKDEFVSDLSVLRSKLDELRTLLNGR